VTRALHQFVPTFEPGATGAHMLEVQRMVREDLGLESEIFAEHIRGDFASPEIGARTFTEYRGAPDDILLYQMAIGSTVADFVRERVESFPGRSLVVNHHNFTPPRFLQPWEHGVTWGVTWGERQLRELAPHSELGIAVSSFNRDELIKAGFEHTTVAPVLVDLERMGWEVDGDLEARLKEGKQGHDWFFIGRIAPNKCQHDIVKAFAAYRHLYDPQARLWLTGGAESSSYADAIRRMVTDLGLDGCVTITGPLPQPAVAAHFRTADVFVSLSEHEGFLVPLLEAWWHRLPIVAFAAAAVPETLGEGGLLLRNKRPAIVAAAVHRVLSDYPLEMSLIKAGTRRLGAKFTLPVARARMADALRPLI
jgi:glycosyltransferase involved in cell wall biosynthesis